jgi:outer membrane protein OmpA-like peptidoglycan-associated protein
MKLFRLSCIALIAILGLSACKSTKNATARATKIERLYHDLKSTLKDADVSYTKRGGVKVVYPEIATFDFNKDVIKSEAYGSFKSFASLLKDYPTLDIVVKGYTDNIGTDEVNLNLSQRRADNSKAILVQNGVNGSRISTKGMGSKRPVASNNTDQGRQSNRRVEFLIYD